MAIRSSHDRTLVGLAAVFCWIVFGATMVTASDDGAESSGGAEPSKSNGPFARLMNERFFIGPGTLSYHPAGESMAAVRLPGDFESHAALLLSGGWLARKAPDVLRAVVKDCAMRLPLILLVSSTEDRERVDQLLGNPQLPTDIFRYVEVRTDTGWVRDFGPILVCRASGGIAAIDSVYIKPGRENDDRAAAVIARGIEVQTSRTPLSFEGGNLLSNGRGLIVTTTQSINANIEGGHSLDEAKRFFGQQLGAHQVVVLEHLRGETTGHVDMFACFTSPDTIVVGQYAESADPENSALLDRNAARLAEVDTSAGRLRVVRMAMPPRDDGRWRSYTNVIFADGVFLVPTFPKVDPAGAAEALAVYGRLLPDRRVKAVDATRLSPFQGGLRCVSGYVPKADGDAKE